MTLSRLPDLSNLAPAQQFLQLAAIKEYHIDSAICTLAAMGVAAAKAPNPASQAINLQKRQWEETPSREGKGVAQEVKLRGFGHPKWTPATVAVAEFVPNGQGKTNVTTPNQRSESRNEISKPGPSFDARPRHLDKQQTQLGGAQKNVGDDLDDKGEKLDKMDARKLLDIKLDSRLRSHTIEFEPSSLEPAGGADIATDARAGRSLSSPPKVSFSEIKQLTAPSKSHWDPSWFGSARTASGESQEEASYLIIKCRRI